MYGRGSRSCKRSNERLESCHSLFMIGNPQNSGGMICREDASPVRSDNGSISEFLQCDSTTKNGACRCGSKAHDDERLNQPNLGRKPWIAGLYLAGRRRQVQLSCSCSLPLEVLHCVGQIDLLSIHTRHIECSIQKFASRPDKWDPYHVLLLSGLFTYQHDFRIRWAFPEYRLCSVPVQRAGDTFSCVFPESLNCFDMCGLDATAADVL